jgi:hypothetical protein
VYSGVYGMALATEHSKPKGSDNRENAGGLRRIASPMTAKEESGNSTLSKQVDRNR